MIKEKMIREYKEKIDTCEKVITANTDQIRAIRKEGPDRYFYSIEELAHERKVQDAKKQCYVQFIKDIEEL